MLKRKSASCSMTRCAGPTIVALNKIKSPIGSRPIDRIYEGLKRIDRIAGVVPATGGPPGASRRRNHRGMDRINATAHTPAACSATPWRRAGAWWVTVVVKATFRLVPGQLAQPTAPLALVREDHYRAATASSLEAASDTVAPYLPGTGVVLTGHAYPPEGRAGTATTARLAIGRERPLLDKTVYAYGNRSGTVVQPFKKMPLVYERAYGGPGIGENPVGVGAPGTGALPNLYDARRPEQPAGFGPISRSWPVRRRLLGTFDEQALHATEPEIPEGLDWRYYHAAPPDQQIEHLRGDEWIVLDGMHPTLARVQTRLPSAVGKARWHLLSFSGAGAGTAIDLVADTLIIDADSLVCSVLWRGRFALKRPEMAAWVGVSAGVELAGQPIRWPEINDPARAELATAKTMAFRLPHEAMPNPLAGTSALDLRAMGVSVLPFAAADPNRPAAPTSIGEARWPVVERASESVSGTAAIDFQQMIKAIVPFRPAAPPLLLNADPAATGAMDARQLRPALPFAPFDPSRPVFAAAPQAALPRVPSPLGGTADPDMQQAIRAALPFLGTPQPGPHVEAPVREPVPSSERPALLPEAPPTPRGHAPPIVQAPPPMQAPPVHSLPPTQEPPSFVGLPREQGSSSPPMPMPAPAPAPAAPAPVSPTIEAPIKAPSAETPLSLRDQVRARLQASQSLQGLALVAADLHEIDFRSASLSGLDLRRSNLRGANLAGVQAAEIQLESADLTEANLEGADLNRANLSRAAITKTCFKNANLTGANLQRLVGDAPSFRSAKLQGADLRQAQAPGAVFDDAVLRNASTMKADLTGARFVRADLAGANLRESKLREANFSHANLEGADLRDADLTGANVYGASRKTAKITPAQVNDLLEIDAAQDSTSRKEG